MATKKKKVEWTEARRKSFIISALRSASSRYPPKYECLNAAKVGKKINKATGRLAEHYKCARCKKLFVAKEVQVDHIEPVISITDGFIDWNTYISRLLTTLDNYQVLCVTCHAVKSAGEKEARKANKNGHR